jgi:ubiquinone/menaquinone biosynthesis C-methylase UbiE
MSDFAAGYEPPRAKNEQREDLTVPFAGLLGDVSGKRVLEYGCGDGRLTVRLARSGAWVSAFDISGSSVELTRRRAEANGVRVEAVEAAAERLPYADETFDLACGRAVLQHLDVDRARGELQRVLKLGGKAVFAEPLLYGDIEAWANGFGEFGYRKLRLLPRLERLDGYLLERFPSLRRHCRYAVVWMVR